MKHRQLLPLLILLMVTFSSCEVIGGIFKAGVWVGVLLVLVVVFIIVWLVSKSSGKQ